MTLTKTQRDRILDMLDRMDSREVDAMSISFERFKKWLKRVANDIYRAISDAISDAWNWFKSIF